MRIFKRRRIKLMESLQLLRDLGYGQGLNLRDEELERLAIDSEVTKTLVLQYQEFHGDLEPDARLLEITEEHLHSPRCGCPDIMPAGQSKWSESCQHNITTNHGLGGRNEMSTEELEKIWLQACGAWEAVSDITMPYRPKDKDVRITADWGGMGRGTLAWSYLPSGDCSDTMQQKYNRAVNWYPKLIYPTIIHELGHALGLSHQKRGNIMYYAITDQQELGSADIKQIQVRYGEAKQRPEPPTPEPPKGPTIGREVVIRGDFDFQIQNIGE